MADDADLVLSRKMLPLIASRETTLPPPSPAGPANPREIMSPDKFALTVAPRGGGSFDTGLRAEEIGPIPEIHFCLVIPEIDEATRHKDKNLRNSIRRYLSEWDFFLRVNIVIFDCDELLRDDKQCTQIPWDACKIKCVQIL